MKPLSFLIAVFALTFAASVGTSDAHVIEKDVIQAKYDVRHLIIHLTSEYMEVVHIAANAPYLGRPASRFIEVGSDVEDGFDMLVRPPPDWVLKSEIKNYS